MQITAIIPAYNEAETIEEIVTKLTNHPLLDEVVVISDGSQDATPSLARNAGANVVELEQNQGKGAAMEAGLETKAAQKANIILFLDADLIGLTAEHIKQLLQPVLTDKAEMTLGIFTNGRTTTDIGHKLTPFLSGQRAVKREVIDNVSNLAVTRFGVEMALTKQAKENNIRVKKVKLKDLTHRMKEEKMGFWEGLGKRLKMYWEVIKSFPDEENKFFDK